MADRLENLVKEAEADITKQTIVRPAKGRGNASTPRISLTIGIWLVAILLGAFQFDEVVSIFSTPAESKIEKDLGSILTTASTSLRQYEIINGVLPPILPNPAIRGLVKYQRLTDFNYQLTATIGGVTMVMDATSTSPHRKAEEE